jgi:hypothetical protein
VPAPPNLTPTEEPDPATIGVDVSIAKSTVGEQIASEFSQSTLPDASPTGSPVVGVPAGLARSVPLITAIEPPPAVERTRPPVRFSRRRAPRSLPAPDSRSLPR